MKKQLQKSRATVPLRKWKIIYTKKLHAQCKYTIDIIELKQETLPNLAKDPGGQQLISQQIIV